MYHQTDSSGSNYSTTGVEGGSETNKTQPVSKADITPQRTDGTQALIVPGNSPMFILCYLKI